MVGTLAGAPPVPRRSSQTPVSPASRAPSASTFQSISHVHAGRRRRAHSFASRLEDSRMGFRDPNVLRDHHDREAIQDADRRELLALPRRRPVADDPEPATPQRIQGFDCIRKEPPGPLL